MKEDFKKAVAEVLERMNELQGYILIAMDDKGQYNHLNGPCLRMVAQVAGENAQVMNIFETGIALVKKKKEFDELMAKYGESHKE